MKAHKPMYLCIANFENESDKEKNYSKFVRIVNYSKVKENQNTNGSFLDTQKGNVVYVKDLFDVGTIKELHVANSVTIID